MLLLLFLLLRRGRTGHAIRRSTRSLAVTALLTLTLAVIGGLGDTRPFAGVGRASAASVSLAPADFAAQMLALINVERRRAGLPELAWMSDVDRVAVDRAVDMATLGYFDHFNPAGIGAAHLLRAYGVPHDILGENIARSTYPAAQVVRNVHEAFMASPGHRANVLEGRFHRVGIGAAVVDRTYYFAIVFVD